MEEERRKVRDYGKNIPACEDSYKAQALRELALRLQKESEIEDLLRRLEACVDILDCMDAKAISRETGMDEAKSERLRRIALGGAA